MSLSTYSIMRVGGYILLAVVCWMVVRRVMSLAYRMITGSFLPVVALVRDVSMTPVAYRKKKTRYKHKLVKGCG